MKTIVQFAYKDMIKPPPQGLEVDCRVIANPWRRGVPDMVLRQRVRSAEGFQEAVQKGVELLKSHEAIYVGCAFGKHRSVAVAEEIALRTGANIVKETRGDYL